MKKILTAFLTISMLFSLTMPAMAAGGNITYSGDAGEFIFAPGSDYSPTDLFPNFKDVMPGDTLTQDIVVKNNAKKSVKISMRALGAHKDSKEFLSQLNLYVEKVTATPLFEAPADQTAQLTEWREIGVLAPGGEVQLRVGLQVPVELDNESKALIGYLDWGFIVEEIEDKDPQTGDVTKVWIWVLGIVISGAVVLILIIKRRKDSKEEAEQEVRRQ